MAHHTQKLTDKIVLITGASSGIGEACARAFAEQGARLILAARRVQRLEQLAQELRNKFATSSLCLKLDVADRAAVSAAVANLAEDWQAIDVLVNNAGLARGMESFQEGNLDHWEQMMEVNVMGVLYVTRLVLPLMLRRNSGHIINIGSIAGRAAYPNGAIYCGSKSALKTITEGLRMDLVKTNLRVSNIEPGMVETDFSLVRFEGDADRAKKVYQNIQPLRPQDIAEIALFMANRPAHVQICDMVVTPTHQASATVVHRS